MFVLLFNQFLNKRFIKKRDSHRNRNRPTVIVIGLPIRQYPWSLKIFGFCRYLLKQQRIQTKWKDAIYLMCLCLDNIQHLLYVSVS
jgi:hypothetical protein